MKIRELFEETISNTYHGDIKVPTDWTDLSQLSTLFPGYTPGCKVIGNFDCSRCIKLTSLEGAPSSVSESFYAYNCSKLKSLHGAPTFVGGDFSCNDCKSLTSLEGAPSSVGDNFYCERCKSLTSLEGAPSSIGAGFSFLKCVSLRKPILSVFKIKNLKAIECDNTQVWTIVNNHLQGKRNILDCQDELFDNGLKEYAKL